MDTPPRFLLDDDAGFRAFLKENRKVVAFFRGVGCPYSAHFEPQWMPIEAPPGWARCIREVGEGGRGPVGDMYRIERTPSVLAFVDGAESSRVEAILTIGLGVRKYERWLASLG
jgi:hypothetical protein